jgi:hypothetical protein
LNFILPAAIVLTVAGGASLRGADGAVPWHVSQVSRRVMVSFLAAHARHPKIDLDLIFEVAAGLMLGSPRRHRGKSD